MSQWLQMRRYLAMAAVPFLSLCLFCNAHATSWVATADGVVGLWHGDGNGNDSAHSNNAALFGGVSFAKAVIGLGFKCDGVDSRIVVPDVPMLNFHAQQDFSIEAWVKPADAPGNFQGIATLVSKRLAPDTITQLGYELYLRDGKLSFQLADKLEAYSWHNFESAGPDLRDGKFHHVAVTVKRDSTTGGTLYVDGQPVLTFDPTVCPGDLSNSEPLRIGNHPMGGLPCFLKGMIDEVSIYNRALSAAEVQIAAQRKADKAMLSLSPATQTKAAQVRAMSRQAGGTMRIEFSGGAATYVVEATTNLKDWEPIGTAVQDADGSFHIEDADASKFSQRFYRIVPQ